MAAIVSFSTGDFFEDAMAGLEGLKSPPFLPGGDDRYPLPFPFPKALRLEGGILFQGDVDGPPVMSAEGTDRNPLPRHLCTLS